MKPFLPTSILFLLRFVVALIWLYEGFWLKILVIAPHELAVVEAVNPFSFLSARGFMALIGAGETLLAIGVLSGLFPRFLAYFQVGLLISMNTIGILYSGAITDPSELLVRNLPFLACIVVLGSNGTRLRNPV